MLRNFGRSARLAIISLVLQMSKKATIPAVGRVVADIKSQEKDQCSSNTANFFHQLRAKSGQSTEVQNRDEGRNADNPSDVKYTVVVKHSARQIK